jgi:4,5-dihydroxyphthalate decarboxylase
MSLSNYVTLVSADKAPFIAIPAFPSRVFRHGYFFINTEKGSRRRPISRASAAACPNTP